MQCKDVMVKLIEMKKINQCQLTQVAVLLAWIRQDSSTQSQSKRTTWVSQIYRAVHDRSSYLFSNQSEDRQRAEPINLIFVWKFSERVVVSFSQQWPEAIVFTAGVCIQRWKNGASLKGQGYDQIRAIMTRITKCPIYYCNPHVCIPFMLVGRHLIRRYRQHDNKYEILIRVTLIDGWRTGKWQ